MIKLNGKADLIKKQYYNSLHVMLNYISQSIDAILEEFYAAKSIVWYQVIGTHH